LKKLQTPISDKNWQTFCHTFVTQNYGTNLALPGSMQIN